MTAEETVDRVMARLLANFVPQQDDVPAIRNAAIKLVAEGFTENDAVVWLRNMEEVDPALPEELALKRMAVVRARYTT